MGFALFGKGQSFRHPQLDVGRTQIRLLRILKNQGWVECELSTYDFDDSIPPYCALSYTWGSAPSDYQIWINSSSFSVSKNLYMFFFALTSIEANKCLIWIDQICIDQSSPSEKSNQVSMMSNIYERALGVIVWLDPSTELAYNLTTLLDRVCETEKLCPQDIDDLPEGAAIELAELLWKNPYWSRLWIVQEVILASSIMIHHGRYRINWKSSLALLSRMEALVSRTDLQQRAGYQIRYLHENAACSVNEHLGKRSWRFNLEDRSNLLSENETVVVGDFSRPMRIFCRNKCSDPRDKVYGLLSIAPPAVPIVVDYQKSIEEVFCDAIRSVAVEQARLHNRNPALPFFEDICNICCILANEMLDVTFPRPKLASDGTMRIEQHLGRLLYEEVAAHGLLRGGRKHGKLRLKTDQHEKIYADSVVALYRGQLRRSLS